MQINDDDSDCSIGDIENNIFPEIAICDANVNLFEELNGCLKFRDSEDHGEGRITGYANLIA